MHVAILGAGNWGTTMAIGLYHSGHEVALWEYDRAQAELVARTRQNERFLPGYRVPDGVRVSSNIEQVVTGAAMCVLAVPVQCCRAVVRDLKRLVGGTMVVSLMKGIERDSLYPVSEICAQELDGFSRATFAAVSGPTIAVEVAAGLPTSAVVASSSRQTAMEVQNSLSTHLLRLYTTDDVIGVELAGALKNVIALAAGMCDGLGLGVNAKGALITRGLAEITRLGTAMGGRRETFAGLSGVGDLMTTCTSPHSRNRRVGESIARGETLPDVLKRMVMVAEGVWTAEAAMELARRHRVDMPITAAVCGVLSGAKSPPDAVAELMRRDLKSED